MVAMDTTGTVAAADAGDSMADRPETNPGGEPARTLSARSRALARAAEALRSAAEERGYAVAVASALEDMESALEAMATTTDELRRESLWRLREAEALRSGQADAVAAAAGEFSRLAGSLHRSRQACGALHGRIRPQLAEVRSSAET
jgi:hypothetical protein